MAYEDILRAYEAARRKAQLRGLPVSKEEATATMYPALFERRKQAASDADIGLRRDALELEREKVAEKNRQFSENIALNRSIFDQTMDFQRGAGDKAARLGLLGVGVAGIGGLGTSLLALKQNEEFRKLLMAKYGIK